MKYIKVAIDNTEDKVIIDDGSKCVCGKCEIEEHTCPYGEEINNDYESMCKCCAYCSQQCAYDI